MLSHVIALFLVVCTLAYPASAQSDAELLAAAKMLGSLKIGGTFKPKENEPLLGCKVKSVLMTIERLAGGDKIDKENSNVIAAQNCDEPNEHGRYARCTTAGFVFPQRGGHATFSGYCRIGRSDPPLYMRDDKMMAVPEVQVPQDCHAFVDRVGQLVGGKLSHSDDTDFRLDLMPPLAGRGKFLQNYASVTCEPWAEPRWNIVGLHWQANDRPSPKYFSVLAEVGAFLLKDSIVKPIDDCLKLARKGVRDAEVRTSKTLVTCNAETGTEGSVGVYVEQIK